MQSELYQDCTMTSEPDAWPSSAPLETGALLRSLAAASDWKAVCEELRRAVAERLPDSRLDVYEIQPDGGLTARFTSAAENPPAVAPAGGEIQLRRQLQRLGYGAIIVIPLNAHGGRCGWLTLARQTGRLPLAAQLLVEQIAPLIGLWLRVEQRDRAMAASADRAALIERRLRATDALRLQATLVSGAAHDIGNLLTTMIGYAQILQQDLPAPFQDDIRMIIRAVDDARLLLRRLGRGEAAPEHANSPIISVRAIVDEVVKLTRPLWERRAGLRMETWIERAPSVRMPAEDLREVLVNLIMNAVAAVQDAGTITIRADAVAGRAIIAVADTGHGIAREYQSAIFQPFVSSRADGSGLGLSVSRALIESHGGTLVVDSEPGSGATFTISLPLGQ